MQEATQQSAIRLAWGGVAPFIISAALGVIGLWQDIALQAFLVYSAVILSFLGGIHWGLAMGERLSQPQGRLVICMIPPLLAWCSVAFFTPLIALVVLALFYLLWLKYDLNSVDDDWYQKMRRPITFVVAGCHFLWFIALASERVLSVNA
ncbi:DUF3429 domain-containing protein [Aliidiomarina sp. Khilg15.8]